jgi:lysophospholipase L1-like esterase
MKPELTGLHHPVFFLVLGDQVAGGYNATGLNFVGGKGHARLLLNNHAGYPEWEGRDLATLFPELELVDLARDGATTNRARASLERALTFQAVPPFITGDLVVLIHVGGNDFFANPEVMLEPEVTQSVASSMRMNLAMMISLLRKRYENPSQRVVVLAGNIIDPTDGTGIVPDGYQEGACRWLSDPQVVAGREQMLCNLQHMNREIAREAAVRGAQLVDAHAALQGHGLNAGEACWVAPDGQKLLDAGHHALRQAAWRVLMEAPLAPY